MAMLILALLLSAVSLGAYMLMPSSGKRLRLSRPTLATLHGLLGTAGLAIFLSMLMTATQEASTSVWTAASLTTVGFVLGAVLFLQRRYSHKTPDLILTSHIIFAGMGALVIAALLL